MYAATRASAEGTAGVKKTLQSIIHVQPDSRGTYDDVTESRNFCVRVQLEKLLERKGKDTVRCKLEC